MINRSNSVSFWVASMILLQDKPKDRKKVTKKFILICEVRTSLYTFTSGLANLLMRQCLRKINNFHTLMGVIAGLNTSSINRLKAIKSDMAKKILVVTQELLLFALKAPQ